MLVRRRKFYKKTFIKNLNHQTIRTFSLEHADAVKNLKLVQTLEVMMICEQINDRGLFEVRA